MRHRQLGLLAVAAVVVQSGPSFIGAGTAFAQTPPSPAAGVTLSLSIEPAAGFGAFLPGIARDYTTSLAARASSTGVTTTLTVLDPSSAAPGHLVNASYALPQALQAKAQSATGSGSTAFAPIGVPDSPLAIWSWPAPIADEPITISLMQSIGASDGLLAGDYGKTLEFTLSSVSP